MSIFVSIVGLLFGKKVAIKEKEVMATVGQRFIFSDQTVEDKETGLVWMRDANISGTVCWYDAIDFINQLNRHRYAGYNDWRLPTKEELQTLVDYANHHASIDLIHGWRGLGLDWIELNELLNKIGFKNVQSEFYWSFTSTDYAIIPNKVWMVLMREGVWLAAHNKHDGPSYPGVCVWPVRSGQ